MIRETCPHVAVAGRIAPVVVVGMAALHAQVVVLVLVLVAPEIPRWEDRSKRLAR